MRWKQVFTAAFLVCGATAFASAGARAATTAPFTQAAFNQAQAQGEPILIEIDASWCPTCAKQRPIISRLERDPAFRNLVIFKVNFDTQKPVVREMGARMQSTLIAFRGKTEEARSVGETHEAAIEALMEKAVG